MTARFSLPLGRAEATQVGVGGTRARMGVPLEQCPRPSQLPAAAAPASSADRCTAARNVPLLPLLVANHMCSALFTGCIFGTHVSGITI